MLLRLAYLAVTNGLAMLRLLPMSDRSKDVEILALRHQLTVLERQLHGQGHRIRFSPGDRAFLAALLHRLPRDVLHGMRLLVRPETVCDGTVISSRPVTPEGLGQGGSVARARWHRPRHPARTDPRRHRLPDRSLGHPGGA